MKPGLDPIEHASRDEIAALQLSRLRWSLRHAYERVPQYRAKFEAHGVHPDDLKCLADLGRFPFTTKQDLRDNYPFGLFAVPLRDVVRVHASSGTTGKQIVVGYTRVNDRIALIRLTSMTSSPAQTTDIDALLTRAVRRLPG